MKTEQWKLQKKALESIYQIEGLEQVEVYYDIEETKAFDSATIALAAIALVVTKMAEYVIEDIYGSLKSKLKQIFHSRKHASKSSFDITIAIKIDNSVIMIQDEVENDTEIEQLIEKAKTTCAKLSQGADINVKQLSNEQLNDHLSKMVPI